ncbi:MAG: GAF and ANTAR domain-containing protein [Geodermatophilaceae bacterium]|nr:GAF and ANTAR domain-containing protein [Geodermatophilaceae bacterium]
MTAFPGIPERTDRDDPGSRGTTVVNREQYLAETFVELADTLVDDFDVIDFLYLLATRTVELLHASAAGIMMADQRGGLQVMASSGEQARLLELFEVQSNEGPCLDCYRSGAIVSVGGVSAMHSRWPTFTPRLLELGFGSAQAIPLRLRGETIGALNIFRTEPIGLSAETLLLGQALANVATVGLIQQRAISTQELLSEQLQTALISRIVLEQAKGVLAERTGLGMNEAFRVMREYARRRGQLLIKVAEGVVDGTLEDLLAPTSVGSGPSRRGPGR